MTCFTPFAALRRSFDLLTRSPGDPVVLDVADVAGIPGRWVSAAELGRWLAWADVETSDAVWRNVIARVRGGEATWTVIAAGLALPGLYGARKSLCRGMDDEAADLEAEMLSSLVAQLRSLDLAPGAVCGRLIYAVRKAGQRYRYTLDRSRQRDRLWKAIDPPAVRTEARGPVTVLAEAITAGTLSPLEAELVARTHLEGRSLGPVAQALGLSYRTARRRRQRAQQRLAQALDEKVSA